VPSGQRSHAALRCAALRCDALRCDAMRQTRPLGSGRLATHLDFYDSGDEMLMMTTMTTELTTQ